MRITNNNGTYLLNESTLPVYVSDELHLYAVEEYEKGDPCQHWLDDLKSDGVEFVATNHTGYSSIE
ncbi:hypothetical protein F6Q08_20635 [Pectobacterium parmentieri]|nr:hypothetical protein [Pectobacterium parmentieri]